jgi:hypothetical protein
MKQIEKERDINQDWQEMKQVILGAAKKFKLSKDAKNANHWWNDEYKRAIQEKKKQEGNV